MNWHPEPQKITRNVARVLRAEPPLSGFCSRTGRRGNPAQQSKTMIAWSVLAGVVGVLGTWAGLIRVSRRHSSPSPVLCWVLGLAAPLPAWLVAFLGLLGASPGGRPELSMALSWILSASSALLGVIVTDAAVRHLQEAERTRSAVTYWLLGLAAIFPAWCIALLGLLWNRP